jgi:probable rRNA maturation factor
MISIDIISDNNHWNKKIKKKKFFFNKIINLFPKKYKFNKKKVSLTVLLSNNRNIKKLNKKFRNKNKATDILSFPSEDKVNLQKNSYLGDIIISYEFMNKTKRLTNLEFKKKVAKIFIHGFLHLLGYNHIKLKDFKKMIKEEEKIYKPVNIKISNFA